MNHSQQNQHPSISIDDAAHPSDSNYSPAGHPSSSINNAAYPSDSSYRPANQTMPTDDKLAMPNARYSQSYNTGSGASNSNNNDENNSRQLAYPSYPPSAVQSPRGWAQSPTHDPLLGAYSPARSPITPWSPDGMSAANPNLPPPPPYDASRPGTGTNPPTPRDAVSPNSSEHALLGAQHTPRPQSTHVGAPPQSPATAAAHVAGAPPGREGRGGPRTHLQSMTGGMPAYGNSPGQLGPVAQARRRRKMKLGILAGVLCAVLLFLVALVVGVLLGVVKVNNKDDNKPPSQLGSPSF
ncbi:hypothetical protein LZ30DRAFT_750068 [Colletotrichum cereale]|nr:hypothetical protein LZ30DRAFT_750068 [Colletotrichum cereale]